MNKNSVTAITITYSAEGHVTEVKVTQSGKTCTYTESTGTYTVVPAST